MSMHKFLGNFRKNAKQKNYFVGTHQAVRRSYFEPTEDEGNINPITGERINFDDDNSYVDYHHKVIFSTMDSFRDSLKLDFGSKHTGKIEILVSGEVKNLTKNDEWLVEQDEIAYDNWYRPVEIIPLKAEGSILHYRIELEPIEGDKKGEEDF